MLLALFSVGFSPNAVSTPAGMCGFGMPSVGARGAAEGFKRGRGVGTSVLGACGAVACGGGAACCPPCACSGLGASTAAGVEAGGAATAGAEAVAGGLAAAAPLSMLSRARDALRSALRGGMPGGGPAQGGTHGAPPAGHAPSAPCRCAVAVCQLRLCPPVPG